MPLCPKCGATVTVDQLKCLECGTRLIEKPKGEGFFGFFFSGIISIFLPLVGFILYFAFKHRRPKTARFTLVVSILAIIVWILLIALVLYIGLEVLLGIFGDSGFVLLIN